MKPKKTSLKLGSCTNLEIIICGPFEILDRIGPNAYMLEFPISMNVHSVFHVSLLKTYVHDPNHFSDWTLIQVDPKGYFQVYPMCILDMKFMVLQINP
jgi:hypothetical protein